MVPSRSFHVHSVGPFMTSFSRSSLTAAHEFSARHRSLLEASAQAGCFHCGSLFHPRDITRWIREPGGGLDPFTAACPRCDIDAVLPSVAPVPLTGEFLAQMRVRWFDEMSAEDAP